MNLFMNGDFENKNDQLAFALTEQEVKNLLGILDNGGMVKADPRILPRKSNGLALKVTPSNGIIFDTDRVLDIQERDSVDLLTAFETHCVRDKVDHIFSTLRNPSIDGVRKVVMSAFTAGVICGATEMRDNIINSIDLIGDNGVEIYQDLSEDI